jgi:hypothetical protein
MQRFRKTTPREDRLISRRARSRPFSTAGVLRGSLAYGAHIITRTVIRRLRWRQTLARPSVGRSKKRLSSDHWTRLHGRIVHPKWSCDQSNRACRWRNVNCGRFMGRHARIPWWWRRLITVRVIMWAYLWNRLLIDFYLCVYDRLCKVPRVLFNICVCERKLIFLCRVLSFIFYSDTMMKDV